jgi:hypothetical protein
MKTKTKKGFLESTALVVFVIIVFQLFGCSSPPQHPFENSANISEENFAKEWKSRYEAAAAKLERNRNLWQESKIVNYDFVAARYAGGQTNTWNRSPVLIKVRQGEKILIEVVSKSDKSYMARTDGFEDFDTIDKLFNYLRQQLDKGKILEADYNKKLGYPGKNISIRDSFEIHGSRNIVIEKFEIIE